MIQSNYSKILYICAKESNISENLFKEISEVSKVSDSTIRTFFLSPVISKNDKFEVVKKLSLNKLLENVLKLLIMENKENQITQVLSDYIDIYNEDNNLKKITITTAKELTEPRRDLIKSQLKSKWSKDIQLVEKIDESLIAGIKLEYDFKVIDNTIKNKLKVLKSM